MQEPDLFFVIPTYRLREVGETVEQYDEHFWRNGQSVRMIVFDDSSPANQEKYFPLLEQTKTHNDLFYVGPREKDQFIAYLNQRLRDKRLEGLVKNLFRPSYGGNRNYTLMYTLGGLMVSADDDMRPYALMEHSTESLNLDEVCRGRLHKAGENGYSRKSFDIIASFLDVLGKPVSQAPDNYERGELLLDTAMDLETNATLGLARENSLLLQHGPPPFFPTRLRFEDYIYRLWIQQDGVAAAHVYAAQNHIRSNYMRNPPTAEIFNEEVSNLLKRKIKASLSRLDELSIAFDYEGEVTAQDAQEILDKIYRMYERSLKAAEATNNPERVEALRLFAANLQKAFYGFEPDFFQQNLLRIVDDVVSVIKGSIELWPSLVEICYFQKDRKGLPQIRVKNQKIR